jgi:acetylornithine deacetylase/succinyl-diaminopimelate desuccinylase-like protein
MSDIRTDRLVAFASDLVAIPSENPPGAAYDACVERICAELDTCGIGHELVETGTPSESRTCIVGSAGDGPALLYLHGHYDVVPAFSPEQFEPRLEEGRLVGRGASDMKGGLSSMVYGAAAAAERGARVGLVVVPDEETGGRLGAERLAQLGRIDPEAAGAILAEPTWGTIWHAARGAYTLRVTARGRPAHVGLHYEGANAFEAALQAVSALQPLQEALRDRLSHLAFASEHPRARESIMLLGGSAEGGTSFNVVPERFSFTIDRRANAEEDFDEAKAELELALETAKRRGIPIVWDVLQDARSAHTPPDSPLARALAAAVGDVTGKRPSLTCCPGVLEIRVYHALGIPALAFGPGLIESMHKPDEHVPVENLAAAAEIYARAAVALAEGS